MIYFTSELYQRISHTSHVQISFLLISGDCTWKASPVRKNQSVFSNILELQFASFLKQGVFWLERNSFHVRSGECYIYVKEQLTRQRAGSRQ